MTASLLRRFGAAVVFPSLVLFSWTLAAQAADDAAATKPPAAKAEAAAGAATAPAAAPPAPAAEAPRHGARSKAADGTVVIYDRVVGAWRAPALGEAFWIDGRFFRYDNGLWFVAAAATGPWKLTSSDAVPQVGRDRFPAPKIAVTAKLPSGVEAVFEPRLKVYKVAGHKGVFLHDGTFYRVDGGLWLGAPDPEGPWAPASPKPLPVPLRKAVGDPSESQPVTLPSGEVVVWDAASKVFTLKDKPGVVLHDGRFFEKRDSQWFASTQSSTGFVDVTVQDVPLAVRFKFRATSADGSKAGGKKKDGAKAGGNKKDGSAAGGKKNAATKKPAAQ